MAQGRWLRAPLAAAALSLPSLTLASPPDVFSLSFRARFAHGTPTAPALLTQLSGGLDLSVTPDPTGSASARLAVDRAGCLVVAAFETPVSPPSQTRPAQICIAGSGIDEATLNAFMDGQGGADPALEIPLVATGTPGTLTNTSAVTAQLFLRGCGVGTYRKLAELHADPGMLSFQLVLDAIGREQLELSGSNVVMGGFEASAWGDVLSECEGSTAGLPSQPPPGVSEVFSAGSSLNPLDPATIEGQLEGLRDAVDGLVAQ